MELQLRLMFLMTGYLSRSNWLILGGRKVKGKREEDKWKGDGG